MVMLTWSNSQSEPKRSSTISTWKRRGTGRRMITLTASCLFGRMRLAGAGSRPKYATYSVKLLVSLAFLRDPRERDRGGGDEPAKACECVRFLDGRLLPAGCMVSRTYSMVWSSGGSTTALRLLTCCGRAEVFYWLSIFWQLKVIKKSQATKLYGVATRSSVITLAQSCQGTSFPSMCNRDTLLEWSTRPRAHLVQLEPEGWIACPTFLN